MNASPPPPTGASSRREIGSLVALALAAAAILVFLLLVDAVRDAREIRLDRAILLALRNPADLSDPIGPEWFEEVARDVTALGGFTILTLLTLAVAAFLAMTRLTHAAVLVLAAVGGGTVISTVLKHLFDRARPDLVPHATEVFTASFPSGHAMMSAVTYLTLAALVSRVERGRRIRVFALVLGIGLTLLVGASRVYLGVHWPSDVLAGWCVGASWALLCWLAARRLQRGGHVERVGPHGLPDTAPSAEVTTASPSRPRSR
ncbi:MAG TPA: phosphatase PAP2 family protein [Salinarimonas sp.]|nr:phosphatase PAP2 family protein [Salinarimonas sp.]